jgi:phosphohistidine phosphatase
MKSLILVRHAKSDWGDSNLPDFERPLSERGKKDAPEMARRLQERVPVIDAFVSSPARRARKTAQVFALAYDFPKEAIVLKDELYEPDARDFNHAVSTLEDRLNTVVMFSHNNGITDFANHLTNAFIDSIPTCGIFAVRIQAERWQDFMSAEKHFDFFDHPKAGS